MVDLNATVCAIATPAQGMRTILRITGPEAFAVCRGLVREALWPDARGIYRVDLVIDPEIVIEGRLYLFPSPHSYTGQALAEIHVEAGPPAIEALVQKLLGAGVRPAGPGEFTARAYLNGRIDLAQAEAVNEVISCTNRIQCRAAETVLQGRLSSSLDSMRSQILEALSLIEADLDFADGDVTGTPTGEMIDRLRRVQTDLEGSLSESVQADSLAHLPSVGIAGAPNAGKSTLFNALLGSPRSLISEQTKTTRDVLEAVLDLRHGRCVVFDCAGLLLEADDVLDQLAQQAALQSLRRSDLVLFCVDLAKPDWKDDLAIQRHVASNALMGVATKADLLDPAGLARRLDVLVRTFGEPFFPVSADTGMALDALRDMIGQRLLSGRSRPGLSDAGQIHTLVTARLRQAGTEAIDLLGQAIQALGHGQSDVAAMMVRAVYQTLCEAEQHVDDKVLDAIFSRFCIGK